MTTKVLTAVLVMLLTGCSTRSAMTGMGVGVAMIVGGAACHECGASPNSRHGDLSPGVTIAALGVLVLGMSVIGGVGGVAVRAVMGPERDSVTAETEKLSSQDAVLAPIVDHTADVPLVEAVAARDPLAAQLTQQAHTAALRNRCGSIATVGARVHALDADYYQRVFVVDSAIASCL